MKNVMSEKEIFNGKSMASAYSLRKLSEFTARARGTLDKPEYLEPREIIIVEGLLGYLTHPMGDVYDAKVYMEPTEDLRIKRKIRRDCIERNYSEAEVLESLTKRINDCFKFIQPQRTFAFLWPYLS